MKATQNGLPVKGTSHSRGKYWSCNTPEEKKRIPTGKYKIPKLSLLQSTVTQYFSKFGQVNIQQDDNHYLIYIEGKFAIPSPDTLFLDGTLLCSYHITESEYWKVIAESNLAYSRACQYQKDDTIAMKIEEGNYVYPNYVDGLPSNNGQESFRTKVTKSGRINVGITINRNDYHRYIHNLTACFPPEKFPMIISSSLDTTGHPVVTINLQCDSNADVLNCISTDFGRIRNLLFILT